MSTVYRPTVLCSTCGDPLTVDELRAMLADTDFVEHGDRGHLGGFEPTPRNYRMARYLTRTTRRERLERKAEKRREWSDGRAAKADAAQARVHEIADRIPFGQPILVGHHSERHHRRDIARIEAGMAATVEHARKADEHASKADGLEAQLSGAIYSDDVDAVERLEEKLSGLEAERERIKTYNAARRRRKAEAPEWMQEDAEAAGLSERELRGLLDTIRVQPYACPLGQFPRYRLENLGGNITRQRKRLEELRRAREIVAAGGRGRGRAMVSRFASDCAECGGRIEKGAEIVYYRFTREAVHADCVEGV